VFGEMPMYYIDLGCTTPPEGGGGGGGGGGGN
jgi:hypothetical protein